MLIWSKKIVIKDVLYKFSISTPNFQKLITLQLIGKYGGKKINDKSGVL